ncbi:MAG TPA: branched-chain amino acid ABC transporter permease, partial [Methylomirabilota bacterium]|nr:branched-chain amino acid ABC transporter permease [Methylomirabilota bacterium]
MMGAARWFGWSGTVAILAGLPLLLDTYFVYLGNLIAVYVVIALGLNLLLGYTGQISLGHAGFVAIGAYGSAILTLRLGLPFVVTALVGAGLAAFAGLLVGLPALKVRGYYLALVTLAFGEIVQVAARQAKTLTGGNDGLTIPAPQLAGLTLASPANAYYLLWGVALLCILFTTNLVRGRAGRAFQCVRDSEIAAESIGISLTRHKLYAFVLSAFFAGLAGSLYSVLNLYLHPDDFSFGRSVLYLMMVVVGGLGTIAGSILGAVLLAALPEVLRRFQSFQELVFAALLLGSIIFMP